MHRVCRDFCLALECRRSYWQVFLETFRVDVFCREGELLCRNGGHSSRKQNFLFFVFFGSFPLHNDALNCIVTLVGIDQIRLWSAPWGVTPYRCLTLKPGKAGSNPVKHGTIPSFACYSLSCLKCSFYKVDTCLFALCTLHICSYTSAWSDPNYVTKPYKLINPCLNWRTYLNFLPSYSFRFLRTAYLFLIWYLSNARNRANL